MDQRHPFFLWLPVVVYMAAIFFTSSLPEVPGTEGVPDTILHTVGYAGLAMTTLRATAGGRWSGMTLRAMILAWVIATGYGVSDEWHQSFTPFRTPDLRDVASDAIGSLVGLGLAGAWGIMRRDSHVL
ncbi:MAG: VanZ family protein [Vicinamibacterales bacterium]